MKRTAEQAIRDELQSKRILLDRLDEQLSKRKAAQEAARLARVATDDAIRETVREVEALEAALAKIVGQAEEKQEANDVA